MLYQLLLLLFTGWQFFMIAGNGFELKELRRMLYESEKSEKAGDRFYDKMKQYKGSDPVLVAYKGASEAIRAKYAGNPFSKLNHLKDAHRFFGQAVKAQQNNPEIRFIRYSVESNTPKFLDMSDHLEADKQVLMDHILRYPKSRLDAETYKIARDFMLADDDVTDQEKQTIRTAAN